MLVSGEAAESREAFISWWSECSGVSVTVTGWFEVPAIWNNAVSEGHVHETLEAVLALDVLGETPVVSDLLATIFAAGFECGEQHSRDTQAPSKRGMGEWLPG